MSYYTHEKNAKKDDFQSRNESTIVSFPKARIHISYLSFQSQPPISSPSSSPPPFLLTNIHKSTSKIPQNLSPLNSLSHPIPQIPSQHHTNLYHTKLLKQKTPKPNQKKKPSISPTPKSPASVPNPQQTPHRISKSQRPTHKTIGSSLSITVFRTLGGSWHKLEIIHQGE